MTKLLPFFTSSCSFPLPDSDIKNDISGNCPLSFNPYWQRQPHHPTATTATIKLLKHAARALAGGPLGGHFCVWLCISMWPAPACIISTWDS
jgi:hypothetical protein